MLHGPEKVIVWWSQIRGIWRTVASQFRRNYTVLRALCSSLKSCGTYTFSLLIKMFTKCSLNSDQFNKDPTRSKLVVINDHWLLRLRDVSESEEFENICLDSITTPSKFEKCEIVLFPYKVFLFAGRVYSTKFEWQIARNLRFSRAKFLRAMSLKWISEYANL